jgi:hypothetical protein
VKKSSSIEFALTRIAELSTAVIVMAVAGIAPVGYRAIGMLHSPVRQMDVIVMMLIDRKRRGSTRAKERFVFLTRSHG